MADSQRDPCADQVQAAVGGRISRAEAEAILADLKKLRERVKREGDPTTVEQRWRDAVAARAEGTKRDAAYRRRAAAINGRKWNGIVARLDLWKGRYSPVKQVLALIHGLEGGVGRIRDSVEAHAKEYAVRWLGEGLLARIYSEAPELEYRITRGLLGHKDPEFNLRVAQEVTALGTGAGGVSKDPGALKLARIISDVLESARQGLVGLGADIAKVPGYLPHQHDAWRISKVAKDKWIADVRPRLDLEVTFPGRTGPEIDRALSEIHDLILHGRLDETTRGRGRSASPFEQERLLKFKSAEDWVAYSNEYGSGDVMSSVTNYLRNASIAAGRMEVFGTNYAVMLDRVAARLKREVAESPNSYRWKDRERGKLDNIHSWGAVKVMSGEVFRPIDHLAGQIGSAVRAFEILTRLGGIVTSMLPIDQLLNVSQAVLRGVPVQRAWVRPFAEIAYGRGRTADLRRATMQMSDAYEGLLGHLITPFAAYDAAPGMIYRTTHTFFRLLGASWLTDANRAAGTRFWLGEAAWQAGNRFDALKEQFKAGLSRHGIGAGEWDIIRQAKEVLSNGREYVTLDALRRLPDELFTKIAQTDIHEIGLEEADRWARLRQAQRKSAAMISQRSDAFITALAKDRARLTERLAKAAEGHGELYRASIAELVDLEKRLAAVGEDARTTPPARDLGRVEGQMLRRMVEIEKELRDSKRATGARLKEIDAKWSAKWQARERDLAAWLSDTRERMRLRDEQLARLPAETERRVGRAVDQARRDVESKLRRWVQDETDHATIKADWRAQRALTVGGIARRGTPGGEIIAALMQFKGFPIAFTQQVLGQRFAQLGDAGPLGRRVLRTSMGFGTLMATLFVGGLFSRWAKDVTSGKTPQDLLDEHGRVRRDAIAAALVQSGGLGIYGDFLFAPESRLGQGLLATSLGPAVADVFDLTDKVAIPLWLQVTGRDPKGGAKAAKGLARLIIGHVPNLPILRPALDTLFLNSLREAISPGWWRQRETQMGRIYGQRSIMPPTITGQPP